MIENIVVLNGNNIPGADEACLFGDEPVHYTTARDLPNLLVEIGIYKSTSEARRAGRTGPIPEGFTGKFRASRRYFIWIWNPTE